MTIIFNEDNLLTVAKAVRKFNKYASERDLSSIINHMKLTAIDLRSGHGYIATGGFMLTAYMPRYDPDNVYIQASVADHCFSDL